MPEPDLAVLQQWLLTTCTGTGEAHGGDRMPRPSDVVRGSDRLRAEERVDIYARGYRARLRECLKAEFPVLHALVGDQVFGLFADGYVAARPPTSYSMFDLGAGFADFLQETRPQPLGPPGSPDALPTALARLERARAESRRARGVETEPDHQPVAPFAVMTSPDLTVRTPPTLRLLRLDFALLDTVTAADHGVRPPVPEPGDTCYAVARTHYRVRVHVLAPWQHAFLHACAAGGTPLHTAAATTARTCGRDPSRILAALCTWLPLAVDAGLATCTPDDRS
ncbi:HvfC/BufC N-terminal domain-containing protein [Saccharothrix sp. NRRL B-16314]|uniref:HvfC/BufC N-terminal domain-containing protein n=1 Tax=Saccharothrix sp. NRRL B-16314 TaxID=1463825 RepID=UPI00068C58C7|nr:DNA-binding domain-containing protein [Saccharothrix sp. NRRL B-16314]